MDRSHALPADFISLRRARGASACHGPALLLDGVAQRRRSGAGWCVYGLVLHRVVEWPLWHQLWCPAAGQDLPAAGNASDGRRELATGAAVEHRSTASVSKAPAVRRGRGRVGIYGYSGGCFDVLATAGGRRPRSGLATGNCRPYASGSASSEESVRVPTYPAQFYRNRS